MIKGLRVLIREEGLFSLLANEDAPSVQKAKQGLILLLYNKNSTPGAGKNGVEGHLPLLRFLYYYFPPIGDNFEGFFFKLHKVNHFDRMSHCFIENV